MDNTTAASLNMCISAGLVMQEQVENFVAVSDCVMLVLAVFSTMLQIYVLRCAIAHLKRRASDECLHLFLLSMTIGDCILTGVCYPLELLQRIGVIGELPRVVNIAQHCLIWVALSGSSISLILLNVDKLVYFKYPLRYSSFVTRSRGIAVVVIVWTSCATFVLTMWLTKSFMCIDAQCSALGLLRGNTGMYIVFLISVCVLPTLTSLGVALYILRVVAAHKKQLAEEQSLVVTNGTAPHHHSPTFASRLRTFYFIFMTTIFTACTLLPYRIANIQRTLGEPYTPRCLTVLFWWILMDLVTLNAVLNPVLTVTVLPQYRSRIYRKFFGLSDSSEVHTKAVHV